MPARTDWLLRFIVGRTPHDGWIDRIRIMKGIFLFQAEGRAPKWEVNYQFRPYDYGPFTTEIYADLNILMAGSLVTESSDGRSYRATEKGRRYVDGIAFDDDALTDLMDLRVEVSALNFRQLLRRVYKAHPESAQRSIARDVLG